MPNPRDAASFGALAAGLGETPFVIPEVNIKITMPPAELRKYVANLVAQGLYQAKLPWLPGEKIVAGDLEGVANFVIGGLLGMERHLNDGKKN